MLKKDMNAGGKIIWLGGYPAHYNRLLHCVLDKKYPGKLEFLYVGNPSSLRKYEKGELPKSATVLTGKSPLKLFSFLSKSNPHSIIVAGHYPRQLIYASLWGFVTNKNVLYWADTNLLDIFSKNRLLLWTRRVIFKVYFSRMHSLIYTGSRGRDFYVWVCGLKGAKKKLQWLPYPELVSLHSGAGGGRGKQSELLKVLYMGRLAPEKAVDKLIRAFGLIGTEAKIKLCIAGDGPERYKLEKLVDVLSLSNIVEFIGSVSSDQVAPLFNKASVLVLPSNSEPWGVVVSEAMAAGLPVIAPFWVGAVADLVVNKQTGMVINDNSPEEIMRAIEYFIEFPEEAKRMGVAARELIKNGNWGLDGAVAAFGEIIHELKEKD